MPQTSNLLHHLQSAAPSVFYQSKRFYPEIPFVIEDFGGAETVQSGDLKEWLKSEPLYFLSIPTAFH